MIDLKSKVNLKSLLIVAGMSVCISGLLSSSTECSTWDVGNEEINVRWFAEKVKSQSMTNEEEEFVMQVMDKKLKESKDGFISHHLQDTFVSFMKYKIEQGSLDERIKWWVVENANRINKKTGPLTLAELGFMGSDGYGILENFIKISVKEDRLPRDVRDWLFKEAKRISQKTEPLTPAELSFMGSDCYGIFGRFIEISVKEDRLPREVRDWLFKEAKRMREKTTEFTPGEQSFIGSDCYGIFGHFIKISVENNSLPFEIWKWLFEEAKKIREKTTVLTPGDKIILGGDSYGIFEILVEASVENNSLPHEVRNWLFKEAKKIREKTTVLTPGDEIILGGDSYGIFEILVEASVKNNSLPFEIWKWLFEEAEKISKKTTELTLGDKIILGGNFYGIFEIFIEAKIKAGLFTREDEEMFCEIMLSAIKNSVAYADIQSIISCFVKKILNPLNRKVKMSDHDGNRKRFLEHAKKVVEGMHDKK